MDQRHGPPPLPRGAESPSRVAWQSAGRTFASRLDKWKEIKAPFTILRWIVNGVPLPLHNVPRLRVLQNFRLDDLQIAFVEEELERLLRLGAIRVLGQSEQAHISPIRVVPKKNGKHRLIIDMRLLNVSISPPKFKYEDLASLAPLLRQGDYMATIDLKDGFFHVPVNQAHQRLMAFRWNGQAYCYQVLPFGMSASPWLFTRFVRATIRHLRRLGIQVMAYMDDIIVIGQSLDLTRQHLRSTLELLDRLGWQVNYEKSDLVPGQVKEFLGLLVNTTGPPTFRVPPRKSHALRHDIDRLLHQASSGSLVPVRKLAAVVGQGVALTRAILPAKLLLRNAYRDIVRRSSWSASVKLSSATISDLKEWRHGLSTWNGRVAMLRPHDALLDTDASLSGWGASLDLTLSSRTLSATGWWLRGESRHINVLEISAVKNTLLTFRLHLQGKTVKIRCDNIAMVAHLNNMGGRSPPMNKVV